ncbi:MAG: hypothetical protein U1F71_04175 [Verrucomicrobiaceae bacterium]
MTPEEKRELKKRGKQIVEQRSAALHNALKQANPAPIASDEWVQNYRTQNQNQHWLSEHLPGHIPATEVARRFVLLPARDAGHAEPWIECLVCHDVLHSYPLHSTHCSCGTVVITYARPPRITARDDQARAVKLIARGAV